MSTYVTASPVPLFDRLAFPAPQSADGRLLDAAGLQASVRLDLSRLLNVRNALSIEAFLQSEGTVLHYGLPDLLSLSSQSDADLERLAEVVAHGIALYETRLSQVQIKARADPATHTGVRLSIAAAVSVGHQMCRVDFDLAPHEPLASSASLA